MSAIADSLVGEGGAPLLEYHQAAPEGVADSTHADRPDCSFVTPGGLPALDALQASVDGLPFGGSANFLGCVDAVTGVAGD